MEQRIEILELDDLLCESLVNNEDSEFKNKLFNIDLIDQTELEEYEIPDLNERGNHLEENNDGRNIETPYFIVSPVPNSQSGMFSSKSESMTESEES